MDTMRKPEEYWCYETGYINKEDGFFMLFKAYFRIHNLQTDEMWMRDEVFEETSFDEALETAKKLIMQSYPVKEEDEQGFDWQIIRLEQTGDRLSKLEK